MSKLSGNLFSPDDMPSVSAAKYKAQGQDFRDAARKRRALKDEEENRKDALQAQDPYATEDN